MTDKASQTSVAALLLALAGQLLATPAHAAGRVALVIGNASYKEAPLRNPVNDARAVAATLENLGFEVIRVENASKAAMERAIIEFTGRLDEDTSGLFYYAGHGVQVRGRNYLVPVNATIRSEREARIEAVGVNLVLDELEYAGNRVNIVILDACRNNPFERRLRGASRGLAAIDAARGTLIAYATSPGSVAQDGDGRNGLYTEALLRALRLPGLEVEEVFKQVRIKVSERTHYQQIPWESSSLTGAFIFNRTSPAASRTSSTEDRNETLFWESVERSSTPEAYRAYLQQFPNGVFSSLAALRIKELEGKGGANVSRPEHVSAAATKDEDVYQSGEASSITSGGGKADTKPDAPTDSPPYVIAVFPPAGREWVGSHECFDDRPILKAIRDRIHRNTAFEIDYAYDRTVDTLTPKQLEDLVWRQQGIRKHPNPERVHEYGRRIDADAVLLYWWEFYGSNCERVTLDVYLFDLHLEKTYREKASDHDIGIVSDDLMGKFVHGRSLTQSTQ